MKKSIATLHLTLILFVTGTVAQSLVYIETEHVKPEHRGEYYQWAKEYKDLADATSGPDFYVASNEGGYSYIFNLGKEMASLDEHRKKMSEWWKANPKTSELAEKYGHTTYKITRALWRYDETHSYNVEEDRGEEKYHRLTLVKLKQGMGSKAGELLKEYKEAWEKAGMKIDYQVYWNVFGLQAATFQVVQGFTDISEYANYESTIQEKIGKEKFEEWQKRWSEIMMSYEYTDSWGHMELSHFNE